MLMLPACLPARRRGGTFVSNTSSLPAHLARALEPSHALALATALWFVPCIEKLSRSLPETHQTLASARSHAKPPSAGRIGPCTIENPPSIACSWR